MYISVIVGDQHAKGALLSVWCEFLSNLGDALPIPRV